MYLNLLHVDDALKQQTLFLEACRTLQARETEATGAAAAIRLWGKEPALERMRSLISSAIYRNCGSGTVVTFMGSGDFHHVSALLIGLLAEARREPLTIIHFDNHPDWVHFSGGMHCGSWVNRALALPQVERIVTIGTCSRDLIRPHWKGANLDALRDGRIALLPWHSPGGLFGEHDIEHMPEELFFKKLDALITTRNVYITIDKDVLSHEDALTNWDQGKMPLESLLATLRHVLTHHHAIGIDVNGDYSKPHYDGTLSQIMLKKLEALIDQPWSPPHNAASVNQQSNLALLELFGEAV